MTLKEIIKGLLAELIKESKEIKEMGQKVKEDLMEILKEKMIKNKLVAVGITLIFIDLSVDAILGHRLFSEWFELFYFEYSLFTQFIISMIVLYVTYRLLKFLNKNLSQDIIHLYSAQDTPKKVLLMSLSLSHIKEANDFPFQGENKTPFQGESMEEDLMRIEEDAKKTKNQREWEKWHRWSWVQNLRGILIHRETLTELHIMTSSREKTNENKGSFEKLDNEFSSDYFKYFKAMIEKYIQSGYLKKLKAECIIERPVPSNDLRLMKNELDDFKRILKDQNIKEEAIVFDVTSGTKEFSIVFAMGTLTNDIAIQYVDQSGQHIPHQFNFIARAEL